MAKRQGKKCVRVREFLNNEDNGGMAGVQYNGGYEDLSITDCSNKINLEFSYYSERQCANAEYKADKLLELVKAFRSGVKAKVKKARKKGFNYEDEEY